MLTPDREANDPDGGPRSWPDSRKIQSRPTPGEWPAAARAYKWRPAFDQYEVFQYFDKVESILPGLLSGVAAALIAAVSYHSRGQIPAGLRELPYEVPTYVRDIWDVIENEVESRLFLERPAGAFTRPRLTSADFQLVRDITKELRLPDARAELRSWLDARRR
jgi:hypothetical protein